MPHSAIYFPYIEVPNRPDLLRVLLYWDALGTIAPKGVEKSRRLTSLIRADLVRPIAPEEYEYEAADFLASIAETVPAQADDSRWTRLHRSKANYRVWRSLESRGLAKREDQDWALVPESIAALYMAGLAATIGEATDAMPITDQRASFEPFADISDLVDRGALRDKLRAAVLHDILPAPSGPVSANAIARFKARYWDELYAFRLHVERRLLDCAREPDAAYRSELVDQFQEELQYELVEIESKMSERKWVTSRGLMAAAVPSLVSIAKFGATGDPIAPVEALAPLAGEILASRFDKQHPEGPLAYAALARGEFAS